MASDRLEAAVRDLEEIEKETDVELEELRNTIHEVEKLHEEHVEEAHRDEEFIQDLKELHKEIRMIKKIDQHMYKIMEAYEGGKINIEVFKKKYLKDEERFLEVVDEIRTELEEMIRLLSEEERLTNRDLDLEGALDDLLRELNSEHEKMDQTHEHMGELIKG